MEVNSSQEAVEYAEIDIRNPPPIYDRLVLLRTSDNEITDMYVKEITPQVCCGVVVDNLPRYYGTEMMIIMLSIRTIPVDKIKYAGILQSDLMQIDGPRYIKQPAHDAVITSPMWDKKEKCPWLNRVVCFEYHKSSTDISNRTLLLINVNTAKETYYGIDVDKLDEGTIEASFRTFSVSKMRNLRVLQIFGDEMNIFNETKLGTKRKFSENPSSIPWGIKNDTTRKITMKDLITNPGEHNVEIDYECDWKYERDHYGGYTVHGYRVAYKLSNLYRYKDQWWYIYITGSGTFNHMNTMKRYGLEWDSDKKYWIGYIRTEDVPEHIRKAEKSKEVQRFHSQGWTWPDKMKKCTTNGCPRAEGKEGKCHECYLDETYPGGMKCLGWTDIAGKEIPCLSGQETTKRRKYCPVCDYNYNIYFDKYIKPTLPNMSEGY